MCLRKKRIEELELSVATLREKIQEKYPIKTMYDAFCLISPNLDNRPKEVSLELWENYIKVVDEMTALMIEQWTEEQIKNFVDIKDLRKIRGLRAQCGILDDYNNLRDNNDTNI